LYRGGDHHTFGRCLQPGDHGGADDPPLPAERAARGSLRQEARPRRTRRRRRVSYGGQDGETSWVNASEVARLIARLRGGTAIERDAAGARLRILGSRAVERLIDLARSDSEYAVRRAACDVLADIDDTRARTALATLADARGAASVPAAAQDPAAANEWLQTAGEHAPLSDVHALVRALREGEKKASTSRRRQQWVEARGAAHALLARR